MDFPWYAGKEVIREYLRKVNKNGKVGNFEITGSFCSDTCFPGTRIQLVPTGAVLELSGESEQDCEVLNSA